MLLFLQENKKIFRHPEIVNSSATERRHFTVQVNVESFCSVLVKASKFLSLFGHLMRFLQPQGCRN